MNQSKFVATNQLKKNTFQEVTYPTILTALIIAVYFSITPSTANAVIVVNDDFSDGDRSSTGALDVDWYSIGGAFSNNSGIKPLLTVEDDSLGSGTSSGLQSGNALRSEGGGNNSGEFIGRFQTPVSLGNNVGDKVVVSFDWRMDDSEELVPSQARLVFGLFGDSDNEFGTKSILASAGSIVNKQFADFDDDNDSDGNDFLIWARNFGTSAGATLNDGDTNYDGAVDHLDLFDSVTYELGNPNENTVEYGFSADFGNDPVVWGESDGQFERCGSPNAGAPGTCGDLGVFSRVQISDDSQWTSFPAFQPKAENNRIVAEDNVNNILGGAGDNQTLVNPDESSPPTTLTLQRNGIDITDAEYHDEAYINGSVEEYNVILSMERAAEDPEQVGSGINVIYSLSLTAPNGDVLFMESYEMLPLTQTDLDTPVDFDYVIFNNVGANYDQLIDNFMVDVFLAPSSAAAVPEPSVLALLTIGLVSVTTPRNMRRRTQNDSK